MIKLKQRLSGFFQAQILKLRLQKMKKSHQQRKTKSVYNQIPSPKHGKMSNSHNSRNSLVATKQGKMPESTSSTPMPLVESNYPLILKKHRKRPDNQLRNKGRSIYDLPEELLAEILVRLPVKYILRCRCVRKSWYYLIKTPMFITYQLNYQKKKIITHNLNPKYLFFKTEYTHALTLRFDDVQCQEYCTLKCLPGLPDIAWHALSYGLICVSTTLFHSHFDANPNIYLWNPLVQKYKTLPDSPLPFGNTVWKALAFGFVPEINDYVVVHIVKPRSLLGRREPDPHSVIIGVYSLNTNSWKKICQDNVFIRYISFNDAVFLNGTAFWLGISLDRSQILVCFDTKTNILREISLPSRVDMPVIPVIHLFGQSIAYFVWDNGFDYFDMWVLKYDSINEFSWEKKMSVCPTEDIRVEVLGVRNNGEPIVTKSYNLISYNLDNHVANNFVDSWDRWTPFPYYEEGFAPPFFISPFVESLVLLDID